MNVILKIRNAYRRWMGVHRLVETKQGTETFYMVQQKIFGFWWIDRLSIPLRNYDMAKICLESCAADYSPIHGRRIVSVTDERLWDTPARPITPTSSDTE